MWEKFKFLFNYIITAPKVVVTNFFSHEEKENTKLAWRDFFIMKRDAGNYLRHMTEMNKAELMIQNILPYQPNNNSKEYNDIIYSQYMVHLGILEYHKKIISKLPDYLEFQKAELLYRLEERINKMVAEDLPYLDRKRFMVVNNINDNNTPNNQDIVKI